FVRENRPRPIVVAHSFGAFAAAHLARLRHEILGGFVIVDSHLAVPESLRLPVHTPFTAAARLYVTAEEALARFRLIPSQPVPEPAIHHHIARHSLRETAEGWLWKF